MDPLTEVGVGVGTQAASSLLVKAKKHIGYLIKYKDNLKNLKAAGEQLDAKRADAIRFLDDTNRKLKVVSSYTNLWRINADELHESVQDIFSGNRISRLDLWSRYLSSKHAWELAQQINEKVGKAPDFGTTFDRPAPKLGAKFNLRKFMEFQSRLTILNGVLEALMNEEVSMCSMCGMGGTGKTMLAQKLIQRVEADHLFDKVVLVTVSQDPKLEEIQKEIIQQLGLKMDEETTTVRANKLNDWLAKNNTLLVFDDVWWQLKDEDFGHVGIPLGSKTCKIVLTSRNEDECKKMGSQKNFPVGFLERKEAWDLFKLNAGKCVEDLNLGDTAREIADECDGLPIAIVTIATALKDKPLGVWNDSLQQLRNSNLQKISGMEKVYSRIQLSYDLLKDKEAQSCFRLCCLFPEDSDVSPEDLVFMGRGLELFDNVDSISETRDRVEAIIHKLKKSFLLLDGEEDGCVKMHDIMRDFAISISSDPYLVRYGKEMTKWPETRQIENCSAISFMFRKVKVQPMNLSCPKLKLLKLYFGDGSTGLPMGIFEEMKDLKVLLLQVPSLMQQLGILKELRTLFIMETSNDWDESEPPEIEDLFGHDNLKNLENLSLVSRRPYYDFPVEIGLLCNLRFLEFHTLPFVYMPPGVWSKLVKLEELLLPCEFISWGCKEEDGERVNASLDEIESLPLTRLKIGLQEGSSLGEDFIKNLKRFELFMGSSGELFHADHETQSVSLDVADIDVSIVTMNWMIYLLTKSERFKLFNVRNLKNLMILPRSLQLKKIEIFYCEEMECIISTTMQAPCFSNLTHISIWYCSNLKYGFPLSMARELRQLQSMDINGCDELDEIFFRNDGNQITEENVDDAIASNILFPQLKTLKLSGNYKLRVFYGGKEAIELPSVEEITIDYCESIEAFCYGALNAPKLDEVFLNDIYSEDGVRDLNATLKGRKLDHEKLDNDEEFEEDELYIEEDKLKNRDVDDVEDG